MEGESSQSKKQEQKKKRKKRGRKEGAEENEEERKHRRNRLQREGFLYRLTSGQQEKQPAGIWSSGEKVWGQVDMA